MAPQIAELRSMPDDQLIKAHDDLSSQTSVGVNYYVEELARRSQNRQTEAMLRYTWGMTAMTLVITFATICQVAIAVASFCTR